MPLSAVLLATWTGAVASVVALAPAAVASAEAPPTSTAEASEAELPSLVFVAAEGGLDQAALEAELAMRMPELRVTKLEGAVPSEPYLYIQARRETGKLHRVAVIVSDGRAYYEHLDVGEAGSPERVVASTVANLLFSIETGTVEPDQLDVELPLKVAGASEGPVEAPAEPETGTGGGEADPAPAPAQPRVELGFGVGVGQATGLGPPHFADAHLGWFGDLELDLRTRRGLLALVEFRPGGAMKSGYRLTRLRTQLGFGYAWRGPKIELAIAATAAIGVWLVASEGQVEPIRSLDGDARGRPPLLAFGLRLSPGYLVALERGAVRALRIGPRIDLAGGFVTQPAARVAGLVSQSGEELFRLGGVELYAGLELVTWIAPWSRSGG